jgi:2-isopropylmalate synthase
MKNISIYDCTLREGAQAPLVAFSLQDKLKIARILDELGIAYTEGGWPASNPKDRAFFAELRRLDLRQLKVVGFAGTMMEKRRGATDENIRCFAEAGIGAAHFFGKAWDFHVTEVLRQSLAQNIESIYKTIRYYKEHIEEVSFGAEHLFDGFRANPTYVLDLLKAVQEAGADWIDLADTNGGGFPGQVADTVAAIRREIDIPLAVHCHNDTGCAVANTLAAVQSGVSIVECTINGYSERCGMTDLCVVIPNLQLKLGYHCIPPEGLSRLTEVAREVAAMTQRESMLINQPYVGTYAFVHKGGMHADAFLKNPATYQHIDPVMVGNRSNILISDQSGRSTVQQLIAQMALDIAPSPEDVCRILDRIKHYEYLGYQFELSPLSLQLLVQRELGLFRHAIRLEEYALSHRHPQTSADGGGFELKARIATATIDGAVVEVFTVATIGGTVLKLIRDVLGALAVRIENLRDVALLDYTVRAVPNDRQEDQMRVILGVQHEGRSMNFTGIGTTVVEGCLHALLELAEQVLNDVQPLPAAT